MGVILNMATITLSQLDEAEDKLREVQEKASEVNEIFVKVRSTVLSDKEGNIVIDLTSGQKTSLLTEYNKRKTALQNAVNDLL